MHSALTTLHASIPSTKNARQSWVTRNILRLILIDDTRVGVGEAAPLPGYSPDTLQQVRDALSTIVWPREIPHTLQALDQFIESIDAKLPSARYAVETALLDLMARRNNEPIWSLLGGKDPEPVAVATAIWSMDAASFELALCEAVAYRAQAIKLKIGASDSLQADELRIAAIRKRMPNVEIRLDANGGLNLQQATEALASFAKYDISFVEEPVPLESLSRLQSPIPLALDESLINPDIETHIDTLLDTYRPAAVVLKPAVLGGLRTCQRIARKAKSRQIKIVISHTLDGPVGRAAAGHLALLVSDAPAGLSEHPALGPLSGGLETSWMEMGWIDPPEHSGIGLEISW